MNLQGVPQTPHHLPLPTPPVRLSLLSPSIDVSKGVVRLSPSYAHHQGVLQVEYVHLPPSSSRSGRGPLQDSVHITPTLTLFKAVMHVCRSQTHGVLHCLDFHAIGLASFIYPSLSYPFSDSSFPLIRDCIYPTGHVRHCTPTPSLPPSPASCLNHPFNTRGREHASNITLPRDRHKQPSKGGIYSGSSPQGLGHLCAVSLLSTPAPAGGRRPKGISRTTSGLSCEDVGGWC